MSSLAVRSAVMRDVVPMLPVPFFPTINLELPRADLPDVWCSVSYTSTQRIRTSMGLNPWIEEQGLITIGVFGRSGIGDVEVIEQATEIMRRLDAWASDPAYSEDVWFQNVNAPTQLEPTANGDWLPIVVNCFYRSQERD